MPPEVIGAVRRPVLDERLAVQAQDLALRTGRATVGARVAAARLVVDALPELDLDLDVPVVLAVLAADMERVVPVLPRPGRTLVEVLADGAPPVAVVAALDRARSAGCGTVVRAEADGSIDPAIVPGASLVRVEVGGTDPEHVARTIEVAHRHDVPAWADGATTPTDFALLRMAGFDRFSGDFWLRPSLVAPPAVRAERLGAARTLAAVQAAAGDFDALEHTISTDPGLSVKLLRWANSAAGASRSPIGSVRAALVRLGATTVGRWAMLVGVAGLAGDGARVVALTGAGRARTLDLLARRLPGLTSEEAFAIGLFSVLDALVDAPMADVVAEAGLAGVVGEALLDGTGPGGGVLRGVLDFERGALVTGPVPAGAIASAHARGTRWAQQLPWATVS